MIPNPATTSTPAPQSPQSHSAFGNPQSAIGNSQSGSLHARGLALFATLMELAEILLTVFVDTLAGNHALPNSKALPLLGKAIQSLFSLTRLRLTLLHAPQRFTARQVLRLSRAFEQIRHLTGRAFDFSPWTSLTPYQLDALSPKSSPSPSPSPSQSQSSGNPQSSTAVPATSSTPPVNPVPNVNEVPAATVTATPGATLARICENLVEIATELGLPHNFETGFLPAQPPSPSPSPLPSPSQSPSSGNLQSTICNPQSPSVYPVYNVHNIHSVHLGHPASPSPNSTAPP